MHAMPYHFRRNHQDPHVATSRFESDDDFIRGEIKENHVISVLEAVDWQEKTCIILLQHLPCSRHRFLTHWIRKRAVKHGLRRTIANPAQRGM